MFILSYLVIVNKFFLMLWFFRRSSFLTTFYGLYFNQQFQITILVGPLRAALMYCFNSLSFYFLWALLFAVLLFFCACIPFFPLTMRLLQSSNIVNSNSRLCIVSCLPASCYGKSYKEFLLQTIDTPSREGFDPLLAENAEFTE